MKLHDDDVSWPCCEAGEELRELARPVFERGATGAVWQSRRTELRVCPALASPSPTATADCMKFMAVARAEYCKILHAVSWGTHVLEVRSSAAGSRGRAIPRS